MAAVIALVIVANFFGVLGAGVAAMASFRMYQDAIAAGSGPRAYRYLVLLWLWIALGLPACVIGILLLTREVWRA